MDASFYTIGATPTELLVVATRRTWAGLAAGAEGEAVQPEMVLFGVTG